MDVTVEKVPGGFRVDGLDLRNGKCGCTTVLPCCYSWSKVKRSGDTFTFIAKATGPGTKEGHLWSYRVTKGAFTIEVSVEDAEDKDIFSGFYPPRVEEWEAKGWQVASRAGERKSHGLWRCAACRWLYQEDRQAVPFKGLPDDWKCPVCKTGSSSFEQAG